MIKQIVTGVDGSDNANAALRWAVEEADLHGADVEALFVWSPLAECASLVWRYVSSATTIEICFS